MLNCWRKSKGLSANANKPKTYLREIRAYTKITWGETQARKYFSELCSGLEKLADAPLIGKAWEEIAQALRSFPLARHIVFYREYSDGTEVVRVLHASMDVE